LSLHADDQGRQRKEARRQIERLESRFREAALKNDVATLDKMTADDYIGIGPTGVLQTKQQLGIQALSIANQSSSVLLGLFK